MAVAQIRFYPSPTNYNYHVINMKQDDSTGIVTCKMVDESYSMEKGLNFEIKAINGRNQNISDMYLTPVTGNSAVENYVRFDVSNDTSLVLLVKTYFDDGCGWSLDNTRYGEMVNLLNTYSSDEVPSTFVDAYNKSNKKYASLSSFPVYTKGEELSSVKSIFLGATTLYPVYQDEYQINITNSDIPAYTQSGSRHYVYWRFLSSYSSFSSLEAPVTKYTVTQNLTNCTSDFTDTEIEENTQQKFTLTPNSNYKFDTVPTLTDSNGTYNFIANSDGSYSYSITVTSNITITANATEIPKESNVTYALNNCTCNRTETSFEVGKNITFVIDANDKYDFSTYTPYIEYKDYTTKNFIDVSGTKTQYSLSVTIEENKPFTIVATATEILKNFSVTQNLNNCTSDLTDTTIKENTEKTVTLTLTNSDYMWSAIPTITIGTETYNFNLNEENNTYSYTFTATGNITINASAELETFDVNYSLTNCTSNYSSGYVTKGDTYTFELRANEGFEFKTAPYVTDGTTVTNFEYNEKDDFYYCNYTVNSTITIVGNAEEITEVSQILSYVNIYTVSNSNLEILANERILKEVVSSSGSGSSIGNVQTVYVDTGEYILVLQAEYIPIHTTGSDYIRYGGYQSKAIGNIPDSNVITIDCGTIDIAETHNNILDYTPYSIMILSLPFIGDVTLDNDLFMNGSMNITYIINILNGAVTCNVKNTKTGYVTTYTGYCNYNIPIKYNNQLGYREFISLNQSVNSSNILALDTPYLTIFTETPIDENRVYGTTDKTDTGENLKGGYIEADIIDLYISESETDTEQNEILTLFRQGVYLNE